jgi:anti-sigma factor ChrR (cupin superfamily)
VRANEGRWEQLCPGVERKLLWHDREKGRITFLIRAQPGAEFPPHHHDDDEEAYLLSGDLAFDDLVLGAGDYHLARPGVHHPVARTRGGCMLLMTAAA